jgi:hypothetical protein
MSEPTNYIRIGFYNDFKDYDTLLISADSIALLEIEKAFEQLSQGLPEFDFSTLSALDNQFRVELKAYVDTENHGMVKIERNRFEWRLTPFIWNQFKEMTAVLRISERAAHQYLDFESNYFNKEENFIYYDSLQVILAKGEYPLSFWVGHFARENE